MRDEWHSLCLSQEASFGGGGGGKHSPTRFSQYTDCFVGVIVGSTLKNNVIIGKWNERVPGVSSILADFEFACVPVRGYLITSSLSLALSTEQGISIKAFLLPTKQKVIPAR